MVSLRHLSALLALALGLPLSLRAANPVIEGLPAAGAVPNIEPRIPAGKALILPLSAYSDGGQQVSFTVTTSNPKIMARVRSGDPLLHFHVSHQGNGPSDATDPSYEGDLVLQLFREMVPHTADFIAGFAQSGYYDGVTTAADWSAITTVHDGDGATPEVQQFTPPTGGAYKLRLGTTSVTAALAYNATPDQVKAELVKLASVTTAGGITSVVQNGSNYVITFTTTANQSAIEMVQQGGIFHRIADLTDDGNPNTPAVNSSFIFQGGDPLGNGTGGPGFAFDNEFSPEAIFVGRGQLAMANSGYNQSNLKGTNGSQFFITDAQPRFLDFKYTIFGQLTHGWDLLAKMKATPRDTNDAPLKSVKMTQAGVSAQYSDGTHTYNDAVLILSASTLGAANITVTATDASGNKTTQTFAAQAVRDTFNDPPFIRTPANRVGPKNKVISIPFDAVDLEYDYVGIGQGLLNNGNQNSNGQILNPKGFSGFTAANVYAVEGNPQYRGASDNSSPAPYSGPLTGALSATQFDPARRSTDAQRSTDGYVTFTVGVGEKTIKPQPVQVVAAPNTALSSAVVARFTDTDTQGAPGDFTAVINWGDGFASTDAGTVSRDASTGAFASFRVTGTHTYPREGIYPLVVTVTGSAGLKQEIRSTAVVTTKPITVAAGDRQLGGRQWLNREIGRFTDTNAPAAANAYTATVDWGDGVVSPGTIRALGGGEFAIFATHVYRDPETFSYSIRVRKTGAASDQDAVGWGRMDVSGFEGQQHLPPFDQSHLVASLSPVPIDKKSAQSANKPTKETEGDPAGNSQTYLNYELVIINAGNRKSAGGTLTLLLSTDTVANLQPIKDQFGNVTSPADRYVEWGPPVVAGKPERRKTVSIPPLPPGKAVKYTFEKSSLGDYRLRLPPNETGTGYNILLNINWPEALTHMEPIDFSAADGPIQGILVSPKVLKTSEIGSTAQFQVKLDKKPKADVKIPLSTISSTGATDTTEGSLDHTSLTFTPDNWSIPQVVTVTGKRDSALPTGTSTTSTADTTSSTYFVDLQPAVSTDPLFNGLQGPFVTVTNADIDSNVVITASNFSNPPTLTTTEAAGSSHTASFTMRLAKTPTAPVSVQIFVGDTTEGEIILPGDTDPLPDGDPIVVTFTPENATTPQTITVRGKDDSIKDGNITYAVSFQATSDDPQFNGITPQPIAVTNVDDEP